MTAVGNFEHHRTVALVRILRADGNEVRREFHFAVLQVHRVVEIDDALVVRILNRQREVDASGDAFVSASVSECFATEDIHARVDLDTNDASVER